MPERMVMGETNHFQVCASGMKSIMQASQSLQVFNHFESVEPSLHDGDSCSVGPEQCDGGRWF